MTQLATIMVIAGIGALCLAIWYAPAYRHASVPRTLTCPETRSAVSVRLDASRFAATSLFRSPELRVKACTRWPERAGCDQGCLGQVDRDANGGPATP